MSWYLRYNGRHLVHHIELLRLNANKASHPPRPQVFSPKKRQTRYSRTRQEIHLSKNTRNAQRWPQECASKWRWDGIIKEQGEWGESIETIEREREERSNVVQQATNSKPSLASQPPIKENPGELERHYYSELPIKKILIADPITSHRSHYPSSCAIH